MTNQIQMYTFFLLLLLGASVQATTTTTNFLSPSVQSYDQAFRYYFTAVSKNSKVMYVGSDCSTHSNKFSNQMSRLYEKCGAHDFSKTGLNDFVYSDVESLPHQTQLQLNVNPDSAYLDDGTYYNMMGCLGLNSPMECLSDADVAMIECLGMTTNITLHHQPCNEPLSPIAVMGITVGSTCGVTILIVILVLLIDKFRSRNTYQRYNILAVNDDVFEHDEL